MNVSSTPPITALLQAQTTPQAHTPASHDHDGDGDDGRVRAATAPGVGQTVDIDA